MSSTTPLLLLSMNPASCQTKSKTASAKLMPLMTPLKTLFLALVAIVSISLIGDAAAKESGISRYSIVLGNFSWDEAKADAEAKGGILATVGSQEEWDEILKVMPESDVALWLGATNVNSGGKWEWIDGTPWNFDAWYPGEPNGGFYEKWMHTTGKTNNHKWNDTAWLRFDGYVLEKEQPSQMVTSSWSRLLAENSPQPIELCAERA